jgi:hypothetical protein
MSVPYDAEVITEPLMGEINMLAIDCRDIGRHDLAIPLFRFILARRLEKQSAESSGVLRAQSGLGRSLLLSGKPEEGMAIVTKAREDGIRSLPADDPILPALELGWAIGLEVTGEHEKAAQAFEDATRRAAALHPDPTSVDFWRKHMATEFAHAMDYAVRSDDAKAFRAREQLEPR